VEWGAGTVHLVDQPMDPVEPCVVKQHAEHNVPHGSGHIRKFIHLESEPLPEPRVHRKQNERPHERVAHRRVDDGPPDQRSRRWRQPGRDPTSLQPTEVPPTNHKYIVPAAEGVHR
jgi:hypothetical protein